MSAPRHWLYRPENRPRLWLILIGLLVLTVLPEFVVHHHPHFAEQGFTLDASFGFYAWFGFVTCALMVAVAKVLGIFLKRPEHYYDAGANHDAPDAPRPRGEANNRSAPLDASFPVPPESKGSDSGPTDEASFSPLGEGKNTSAQEEAAPSLRGNTGADRRGRSA